MLLIIVVCRLNLEQLNSIETDDLSKANNVL